jgi:hypothetical protein
MRPLRRTTRRRWADTIAPTSIIALAACSTNDDRPLTVEYLTAAVLQPSCGAAQCHSTFAANQTLIFDTVGGTRSSLIKEGLIRFDSKLRYDPANPVQADLIQWVTQTDPLNKGIGRMPWDAPMANEDILYLEQYIQASAPGAQCDPGANGGLACNNRTVVGCRSDWNFGAPVMTCPSNCASGACVE